MCKGLLLLNMTPGLGLKGVSRILESVDQKKILDLELNDFLNLGLKEKQALEILRLRDSSIFRRELDLILKEGIEIVTLYDKDYPFLLSQIYDPPVLLYLKGDRQSLKERLFSIVGSRRASVYGLEMARKFSYEIGLYGFTVVSGLARGIDTQVHQAALASTKTIAVLGSGLLNIYPKENKNLATEITKSGCLISEYSLLTSPKPENFPRRNRIISGLSEGVLVVEAAQKSGALITANFALEQSREVFALPNRVGSTTSKGTNDLIKQGAKLVDSIEDILEDFNVDKENKVIRGLKLSVDENKIFSIISDNQYNIEDVIMKSNLSYTDVSQILLSLKMKKIIKELPGKTYVKI